VCASLVIWLPCFHGENYSKYLLSQRHTGFWSLLHPKIDFNLCQIYGNVLFSAFATWKAFSLGTPVAKKKRTTQALWSFPSPSFPFFVDPWGQWFRPLSSSAFCLVIPLWLVISHFDYYAFFIPGKYSAQCGSVTGGGGRGRTWTAVCPF